MLRFRNILAATDLSPECDRVLRTAAALALRSNALLHVAHAVEPSPVLPALAMAGRAGTELRAAEAEWATALRTLESQVRRSVPDGLPVSHGLLEGQSAPGSVRDHAEEVNADLIVIGAGRDGGATFLGTTADNLLRSCAAPVLVIRDTVPVPVSRVLVAARPTEPCTALAEAALTWAAEFASVADGSPPVRVDVVHVLTELVTGTMPFDRATVEPDRSSALRAVRKRAAPAGAEVNEVVLWGEHVVNAILDYSRERRPDLLVAGSHGRGAIERALVGGTSSALARRAPCSVLLLPPEAWRSPSPAF